MTIGYGLVAAAALACLAPITALAFDPPTTAEFFGRFTVPEDVTIDVQDDGSAIVSTPPGHDGWVVFTLRDDEVPVAGARSVSVEVTVLEDGGGWPEALVGFGLLHGYEQADPPRPFTAGVISPQGDGSLLLAQYTGQGFHVGQSLGGSAITVGDSARLTMREDGGSLVFEVSSGGSSSQSSTANDLIREGLQPGPRIGFILISGGSYRISDLQVESAG